MRRVGETRTRRVEARFISATNKDLEAEVEPGRFREDLYYRLKIIVVDVPPLRERRDDFLALLNRFGESYAAAMGRPPGRVFRAGRGPAVRLRLAGQRPGAAERDPAGRDSLRRGRRRPARSICRPS